MYDHRKAGRELALFGTDPLIGAGLPYWLPDGAAVRYAMETYVRELERRAGYQHVYSPVLAKRELYEISGHWAHYRDDMFPAMVVSGDELVLRPSLCPQHAVIYRSRSHSYRELPLRIAELGGQHRAELSGVLGGLTRVRAMQLNDGHIFATLDQVAAEAAAALALIQTAYLAMGIKVLRYRLSLGGGPASAGKYAGDQEMWQQATAMLAGVLDRSGVDYQAQPGEAAFYGPKIDVQVADHADREATLSTVQVDLYQPARFDLSYTGADGGRHRPVMVHRAIVGSIERAVAVLVEQHGGAFPAWLAPVQVLVLPVTGAELADARSVAAQCLAAGLRAVVAADGSLGARIRDGRLVPYVAVIGAAEAGPGTVALRLRDGRQLGAFPVRDAVCRIAALVNAYSTALWDDTMSG